MAEQVGRFLVYEQLGAWDAGPVFRGFEVRGLIRPAIVKTLAPGFKDRPDCIEVLLEEARIASDLSHPNILRPLDIDEGEVGWYTAFERAPGRTLHEIMEESQRRGVGLDPNGAIHIVIQLLAALAHAHEHTDAAERRLEIVHRDVCPRNVWVSYAGNVELGGFGYASMVGREQPMPPGIDRPRHNYHSPEQASGAQVDERSDVFSAGLILYELLSGQAAYEGDAMDVRAQARRAEIVPLRRSAPHTPGELESIVNGALAPDPERRYPSATAFSEELVRFLVAHDPTFGSKRFASALAMLFGHELREERHRDAHIRGDLFSRSDVARILSFPSFPSLASGTPSSSHKATAEARAVRSPGGHAPRDPHPVSSSPPASTRPLVQAYGTSAASDSSRGPSAMPSSALDTGAYAATRPVQPSHIQAGHSSTSPRTALIRYALIAFAIALVGVGIFAVSSESNKRLVKQKLRAAVVGRKPGAQLTIESIPPGARVFIDDEDTKKSTPLTINNLESETVHDIRLELEGEKAVTSTVSLRAQTQRTVTLAFKDAMVNLSVRSEPSGAEVTINDRPASQFTPLTMDVRVGQELKLRVVREGYRPFDQALTPERGKPITLDVKLEKTAELLAAEAEEAAARKEAGEEEEEGGAGGKGQNSATSKSSSKLKTSADGKKKPDGRTKPDTKAKSGTKASPTPKKKGR